MNEKSKVLFKEEDIEVFRDHWAYFDLHVCHLNMLISSIKGTGFIEVHELIDLLFRLGSPLGWDETYIGNN